MNHLRHLLADAIERNGGYSSGYHDRFPLEWTVGLHYADLDRDHIFKRVLKDFDSTLRMPDDFEWDPDRIWQWVQEDMYEGLNDDMSRQTYGPETAKRYGLPFERFPKAYRRKKDSDTAYFQSKKPGWLLENPYPCIYFKVNFELHGRGGKHLVVTDFEGHRLEGRNSEDWAAIIRNDDDGSFSNVWCRNLLAMIGEWDGMFTSKNASDEMEYLAADRMYLELVDIEEADSKFAESQETRLAEEA